VAVNRAAVISGGVIGKNRIRYYIGMIILPVAVKLNRAVCRAVNGDILYYRVKAVIPVRQKY